jgi:hypothetical protein
MNQTKISSQEWKCTSCSKAKQGKFGNKPYTNVCYFLDATQSDMRVVWNHNDTNLTTTPTFNIGDTIKGLAMRKRESDNKLIIDYKMSQQTIIIT